MTAANILIYVALIGYILYRRVQGHPLKAGRQLFVLPVVLIVLGYGDVTQGATIKPIEITLIVIAGAISFGLGLLRGRADKLSDRNGTPFVQWGAASVILFVANIAAKLVLDVIGLAAGSAGSAVGKSLVLTFGLTLLGEAIALSMRTSGATGLLTQSRGSAARARQPRADRFIDITPSRASAPSPETAPARRSGNPRDGGERLGQLSDQSAENPASMSTSARSVVDALQRHHERHEERHQDRHHHDHGHRHDRERS